MLWFFSIATFVLAVAVNGQDPPKIGHCPHGLVAADAKPCTSNSDCPGLELCCDSVNGQQTCSEPRETKHGECPQSKPINPGLGNCSLDTNCEAYRKCCLSGPHSYVCSDPVYLSASHRKSPTSGRSLFKRSTTDSKECFNPKYGTCPKGELINPTRQCNSDGDCPLNQKCCPFGDGAIKRCSDPDMSKGGQCQTEDKVKALLTGDKKPSKCYIDSNCIDDKKCCKGEECDYYCVPTEGPAKVSSCFSVSKSGECPQVVSNLAEKCNYTAENPDSKCSGNRLCCPKDGNENTAFCSDPYTTKRGKCPKPWEMVTDGAPSCSVDKDCKDLSMKCCQFDSCTYYCAKSVP